MSIDRPALRRALLARYPWIGRADAGPAAVSAGECDGCGHEARLVAPCGPPPSDIGRAGGVGPDWALGRRCLQLWGPELWCAGHQDDAEGLLAWLGRLPDEADDVARLWWVATGEVRAHPDLLAVADRLALLP